METIPWINLADIVAILGLGWRGYSRLDGKKDGLSDKVSHQSEHVARIEGVLSAGDFHRDARPTQ